MSHFLTTQNLILVGVIAHLLLSAAKLVWKTPKQQAQIDGLGDKLDTVLGEVQAAFPPAPNNGGAGEDGAAAAQTNEEALSAQGGAS